MHGEDLISENVEELDESKLGYSVESMVKLSPAFKDYLWGGQNSGIYMVKNVIMILLQKVGSYQHIQLDKVLLLRENIVE